MKNNGGILPIFLVLFCATSFFAQEPIMYPASESDDKQCERLIPKIVDATRTLFIFGDSLCTQRDSTFEQDTITAEKAKFSLHSVGEILTQVTVYTTYDLPGGRVVRTEFYTLGTIGDGIWIATVTPHAFGSLPINLTGYMSAVGIRLLKGKYPNGDCCWGPERWTQLSDKWDPDLQTYPSILTPLAYSRYWRFEKDDRKYLENVLDMLLKK